MYMNQYSDVCLKTTEDQYLPVSIPSCLVISEARKEKCMAFDLFHGNGPSGKMLTKKEAIKALRFNNNITITLHFMSVTLISDDSVLYIIALPKVQCTCNIQTRM